MFNKIFKAWHDSLEDYKISHWFNALASGKLRLEHYKGFLLETYHHAGLNPQIQAYATMFFKGNPREIISKFFKHANSEIGHDVLAANDLENLGVGLDILSRSKPLPNTIAFNAFVLYSIQFESPISYLGYLFHLEFLPTQNGDRYINQLKAIGVPDDSLTFLKEHATVDEGHNKLMKQYIEYFVKDNKTLDEVIYAARSSSFLHRQMIESAFQNGERLFK